MSIAPAIGWPIYSDDSVSYAPAFSSGAWDTTLVLDNVQDRRLSLVARSVDVLAASTKFDVDLGVARDVGVVAVFLPNITKSATPTIRWRGSTVSNFATTVYDSGTVSLWPTGVTAEDADGLNVWIPTLPGSAQTARYWRCEIVDTGNVDGYVDVARVVIAGRFVPPTGLTVGSTLGSESETVRTISDGGAALYGIKRQRRYMDWQLQNVGEVDAMGRIRKMQRQLGTHGQLFAVFDEADTTYMYERAFLAVMRELTALEFGVADYHNVTLRLLEEL